MFRNDVDITAMTGNIPDEYFLDAYSVGNEYIYIDNTIKSTIRSLICPRANGDFISVYVCSTRNRSYESTQAILDRNTIYPRNISPESVSKLLIVDYLGTQTNETLTNFINEATSNGYEEIIRVYEFYKKAFDVKLLINKSKKASIFLVNGNFTTEHYHYLQVSIPIAFPWIFNGHNQLDELELELLSSLQEKTSTHYEATVQKIASRIGFKKIFIEKKIKQLGSSRLIRLKEDKAGELRDINDTINLNLSAIRELLERKSVREIEIAGIESKLQNDSSAQELFDYISCNSKVRIDDVNDYGITFIVADELRFFDDDSIEQYISNESSYIYRPHNRGTGKYTNKQKKSLVKALFVDKSIVIKMCSAYHIEVPSVCRGIGGYRYSTEFDTYMPNPHIDRFECLGNYTALIVDCLRSYDYIGAIEQCIASCQSLNLYDSPVMNEFFDKLWNGEPRECFVLPTGNITNVDGVLEFLKNNESEEDNV